MIKQPNYVFDDELYHHGILGQRWGHRRYQYEDGSWTPEGRERYGEGGAREKSDAQKYKAKVSYNTQKYKANLKSKAQKEKDKRAAKEERVRIKENAKSSRIARKEQAKFDKLNKKEEAKLQNQGRPGSLKFRKTSKMSDEDLANAINRLKLQAEYNKQYTLATQPNSALAKADRFFEGATGKFVRDLAVATVPNVANTVAGKVVDYALKDTGDKVTKELEIAKKKADIESVLSTARKNNAEAKEKEAKATVAYQTKHQAEVKDRAERMFGSKTGSSDSSGKTSSTESSKTVSGSGSSSTSTTSSGKTGFKGETWAKTAASAASAAKSAESVAKSAETIISSFKSKSSSSVSTPSPTILKSASAVVTSEYQVPVSQVLALPEKVKKYNY